jgi:ABC-type thiamine transport system substrate-binding protein
VKHYKLFFCFFFSFFALANTQKLTVLSYSSLLDKGGLGEEIQKLAAQENLNVVFNTNKDFAGILGTLRKLKRQNKLSSVDVVLGLNNAHYKAALAEGLVAEGAVYEEASFSLLINKELLPEKLWPKNWEELKIKLKDKILVQDPRTSEVGLTWLLNSNLSAEESKKIPKKVFPNWSSSFEAFESGLAPALWTYSTSAAYFECAGDAKAKKYSNLPLPNYPKDKNYVALVKGGAKEKLASEKFKALILSEKLQSQIWQKNWMFPALYPEKIKELPKCFSKVWFPKDAKEVEALSPKELLNRLDQWSL